MRRGVWCSMSLFRRYLVLTAAYGSCRKAIRLVDAKQLPVLPDTLDELETYPLTVPMLLSTKTFIVTTNAVIAPIMWVSWVLQDLESFEVRMRHLNPYHYRSRLHPVTFFDHIVN